MKSLFNKIIQSFGYVLLHKQELESNIPIKGLTNFDHANARGKAGIGLDAELRAQGKTNWLEIGTGGRDDNGFIKIDILDYPQGQSPKNYRKLDIINAKDEDIEKLGSFDLVRMQHVFEHFTPEDGLKVLTNCSKLLKTDGYILVSTPDIDIVIDHYKNGSIREINNGWGKGRIGEDAPDSFVFSIFTHSVLSEPHLWCYNAEGLVHQFNKTGLYKDIAVLSMTHPLASIPFTHNRPAEDVVILARKK
jgi:SAM-dependent methyltransferase